MIYGDPVCVGKHYQTYSGEIEVESAPNQDSTLQTAGMYMRQNIIVKHIRVNEVINSSNGYTVTIGR